MKINTEFFKNNKPLLIHGLSGCGKTTYSENLLKDTIILRIDYYNIKNITDINEFLYDKLGKKNITLMFSQKMKPRSLLIDDIHIINKYDKKTYKILIDFITNNKYKLKIIITCNNSFLKNKLLCKMNIYKYELIYTYSEYYKICIKIFKKEKNKLLLNEIDKLIYKNKYDFNTFKSELNLLNSLNERDNYWCNITYNIINKNINDNEIINITDKLNISYNLLENNYIINKDLVKIYEYYLYSDLISKLLMKNNVMNIDYTILSIYNIIFYLNKYNNKINNIIQNKYISKSMTNIVSYNKYNINFIYYEFLIYLLYTIDNEYNNEYNKILLYFNDNYKIELNYSIRKYNYYYQKNIKLDKLLDR